MIYLPSSSLLQAVIMPKTHLISSLPGVPKTEIFPDTLSVVTAGAGGGIPQRTLSKTFQLHGLKFLLFTVNFTGFVGTRRQETRSHHPDSTTVCRQLTPPALCLEANSTRRRNQLPSSERWETPIYLCPKDLARAGDITLRLCQEPGYIRKQSPVP